MIKGKPDIYSPPEPNRGELWKQVQGVLDYAGLRESLDFGLMSRDQAKGMVCLQLNNPDNLDGVLWLLRRKLLPATVTLIDGVVNPRQMPLIMIQR